MGEEIAGVTAFEVAARRIAAGQGDLFLVGAAYNAERKDMLLSLAMAARSGRARRRPCGSAARAARAA